MTTLEEFRSFIKELQSKLALPNNTPQKNQALLQSIKEYCAQTLQQPNLDNNFEREIKDQLFNAERQLEPYKRKPTIGVPQASSSNSQGSYQTPSSTPPIMGGAGESLSKSVSSVPAGAFDPTSSPILRRLMQGKALHNSIIKPGANSQPVNESNSVPPAKSPNESADQGIAKPVIESVPANVSVSPPNGGQSPAVRPTVINSQTESKPSEQSPPPNPPVPVANNPFPSFNMPSPFPSGAPASILHSAQLVFPDLNIRMDLPGSQPVNRIGRQDLEKTITIPLPAGFFDPIVRRNDPGQGAGPNEHFLIEQVAPGEYYIKDPANLSKTYFKNSFVNATGVKIAEGDVFILPVLMNGAMNSLKVQFHDIVP